MSALWSCAGEKTVSARNSAPTGLITFPSEGASFMEGEEVLAIGQAADSDHASADLQATWRLNGEEVCAGAPDDSGASLCTVAFEPGPAELQFIVVDPRGAAGSDTINVSVDATGTPTVAITDPGPGDSFRVGDVIELEATIGDAEDDPADLSSSWSSDIDGDITITMPVESEGVLRGFASLETPGDHSLTLTVTDTDGKSASDSVPITITPANVGPGCEITAPEDGGVGALSALVTFNAAVTDDASVEELSATWTSDLQGELAASTPDSSGAITFATSELAIGTHVVSLSVVDADGVACNDDIVYTVGAPPAVTIASPTADGSYYAAALIEFSGTVTDADDTTDGLSIAWNSTLDGDLDEVDAAVASDGGFAGFSTLTEGEHAITVTATDSLGLTSEDSVIVSVGAPNSAPTCELTSPESGALVPSTTPLIVEGTANDVDVASDMLTAAFSSSVDGDLGTATPTTGGDVLFISPALSVGSHVLTMTISDEVGATCSDNVLVTIGGAPTVSITAPSDGDTVNEGIAVSLEGFVSDTEDLPTALSVMWNSDVDGFLGSSPAALDGTLSFEAAALSTGTHTVTLSATDTDGLSAEATVTLNINDLPSAPTVSLAPDPADTTDDLVVTVVTPGSDSEGDVITTSFAWTVDGVDSGHTGETVVAADTEKGQVWVVTATSHDPFGAGDSASASITIDNAAPAMTSVAIEPASATTNTLLTAVVAGSDVDGDSVSYSYAWTVDGLPAGSDSATLDGTVDFDRGQTVIVTVTPSDESSTGSPMASAPLTVDNTPPGAPGVSIEPAEAVEARDDLQCMLASPSVDDDEDDVSYTVDWTQDGVPFAGATTTLMAGDTVPAASTAAEEAWVCTVTPSDGSATGPAGTASITIERQCDWDGDGHLVDSAACGGDDCDDDDPAISPSAEEVWYDGVDSDCDGASDYDADSDGYDHIDYGGEDCADLDPSRIDCSDGVADYLPGEEAPNGIAHHSLEMDEANDRLILYGGQSYHRLVGSTHAYDLIADEWVEVGTFGIDPGERMGHASAMDPVGDRMFVFGGSMYHTLSNELLVLDTALGAESWTMIDTAGGPPPLTGASMVFDPVREELHIFGGQGYHGLNDELWTYSFGAEEWTGSALSGGPRVAGMASVWDVEGNQAFGFGGQGYHQLSETVWCFDGDSFSEADVGGESLPAVVGAAAAMADGYGGALVYGGQGYHRLGDDAYLIRITGACAVEVERLERGSDGPVPSHGSAMAWSPADGEAFMVGGETYYALSASVTGITP